MNAASGYTLPVRYRYLAEQPIREGSRELPRLLQLLRLDVGGRNAHAQVPVAVFTRPQVAGQRQHGAKLAAGIREMDFVDVLTALLLAELAHRREVLRQY